jgi:hypothetical protein
MFPYLLFPNEVCNHICSYIESPTSKIIKELKNHFEPFDCLKLNKKYNFKHIEVDRLNTVLNTKCSHCLNALNPQEYLDKKIYERLFDIQLCIYCSEKNTNRMMFESCELVLIIFIFIHVWITSACVLTILEFK